MKKVLLLTALFSTAATAMTNEDLKLKPPRVIMNSPHDIGGVMGCIDEATDIWVRYFNAPDHRTYRKTDSVDIEYLTAPATAFAIQTRMLLVSIQRKPEGGTHIQMWGGPIVDALDPDDAASRGHAAVHANKNGRLQQSIDSFKLCLAQPDPTPSVAMAAAAPQMSTADELAKLADLKAKGIITQSEFDAQKAKLLGAR